MTVFWTLGTAAIAFLLELWGMDSASKRGYKRGYDAGLKDGKVAADNWWIGAESSIDQARQKIWREEPKTGAQEERWP
jgi:hypothetical protein